MDKAPKLGATSEGKDIPNTKELPQEPDPYDSSAIEKAVNEAAKSVNSVWIAFISLCVYIFIATYSVTPATLFRDSTVRLPIFNADLPLKIYFLMAPVLIFAAHAYLIVLAKGLSEKIQAYEDVLRQSRSMATKIAAGRRAVRARLDNSIISAAMSARYRDTLGGVSIANGLIAGITMTVVPVALLLLTQLIFLPYQHEHVSWFHRILVLIDVAMCLWFLWPLTAHPFVLFGRILVLLFIGIAFTTSWFLAVFPGEWMYNKLEMHLPHAITDKLFEGSSDPVDYVMKGGVLPFANRLILPDDPKLAEVAGAPSNGVSLSLRGRNFRKAIFDRSNLVRVDFSAVDLEGASLRGARLEGAKFDCAGSQLVTFQGPAGSFDSTYKPEGNFVCTHLTGANLDYARLDRSSFDGAELYGARLIGTTVSNANFRRALLFGAQLRGAVGRGAVFSDARLIAADLSYAQLLAADFTFASLQGARLFSSYLQVADFRGARMQGIGANSASLQGASFEQTFLHAASFSGARIEGASFREAALPNASLTCAAPFRTNFENADRHDVILSQKECGAQWYDIAYEDSYVAPVDEKYSLPTDAVPKRAIRNSFTDYSSEGLVPDLLKLENLDAKTFSVVLDRATADLPEDTKVRVAKFLERLNPGVRRPGQEDAERVFWTDWTKKSAPQESHERALAARLESIACVAEGAPYVARRLLRAGRFDHLYESKGTNEQEKRRIFERLKNASSGGDPTCLGAEGLVDDDFSFRE
ncbi:hypothetical protein AOQ73_12315 [Bradyrhizobium pachyrhizi]|uniref:pentapeptide repeat-containing protein n=1 Tax=Bradyrhizobium pachyrhizi TaxID=280333 RepID=UPI000704E335|nr:pentapeptide repeat-containing protein [Bradyrhizobium pachyrhizi]KRQ07634.1 hypothetical protein AOQ73_12315 [Bradyrhizobium pachyrhizi]